MHRQHQVGLLDDLLAVEVEVGVVAAAAGTLGVGACEVPQLVAGEAVGLRVDPQRLVVRDVHGLGGVPPAWPPPPSSTPEGRARSGWRSTASAAARRLRCGHEVGVDVVVGEARVLVRAR